MGMSTHGWTKNDWAEHNEKIRKQNELIEQRREENARKKEAERVRLAQKITTVVVDKIIHDIVRPGPVSEERECYDVAAEIRHINPELIDLVADVIKIKEEEGV
jgi:hypothetical protein